MKLYRIVGIGFLMGISALLSAQEKKEYPLQKFKVEGRLVLDRDLNEWEEYLTDRQFNNERCCVMLDSSFIKSNIGLDLYKVKENSIDPKEVEGVMYDDK